MTRTGPILLLAALAPLACGGQNLFKTGEKKEPAEDATIALEKGDETKAISILEDALEGDPDNAQYLSILALAYAQRAGIEPLNFATRMADMQSGDAASAGGIQPGNYTALFSIMPDATEATISDIDKAVSLLVVDIPADQRQPGDTFKIAIYQTASMVLHTKILDKNGDGVLTIDEILDLSDTSAAGLLSQLANAQAILAAAGGDDATAQQAAEAIGKYQEQIDAAPGATPEEKLKNYLAANPAAAAQAGQSVP